MPFINVKTNSKISDKESFKADLGQAITAVPGKSEAWLMVDINDERDMWFKGDGSPCVMLEVSIFGKASDEAYDDLTCRLCDLCQKHINIPPDRVYVKYAEIDHWGYNNMNF